MQEQDKARTIFADLSSQNACLELIQKMQNLKLTSHISWLIRVGGAKLIVHRIYVQFFMLVIFAR